MPFNRKAALMRGHRLYTSAATFTAWGAGGPREASTATSRYSSIGWIVSQPSDGITWNEHSPVRVRPFRSAANSNVCNEWVPPKNTQTKSCNIFRQDDGPSPEWLAERNAAGFAINHGMEGSRIERALVKGCSPLVVTLRQVSELMRPPVDAANDTAPAVKDQNPGSEGERKHNQGSILPSVPMLLRAVADGMRPRVIVHPNGELTRISTGHTFEKGWHLAGWKSKSELHGIIVQDGEIVAYGNDNGRPCRPEYVADPLGLVVDKKSETRQHVDLQDEENRAYVKLKAASVYVSAQSPDAPRSLSPPPRTARAVDNDKMLATARANTKVMPTVTRLPDGVAHAYGRLAGIAEPTGNSAAPMHEVLTEFERIDKLSDAGLAYADLEVVEAIMEDASFRTIGLARGYAESSAHRMGRKVVEDTLKRISEKIAA